MTIHEVREKDLLVLSNLFATTHLDSRPEEDWTNTTALSYLEYYYHIQPDLFLVAYCEDGIPVGAIMSILKPSFDGIHLTQLELFAAEQIKEQDSNEVKKELLSNHLELADTKYHPTQIEVIATKNVATDLQNMLGIEINSSFVVLHGNFEDCMTEIRNSFS